MNRRSHAGGVVSVVLFSLCAWGSPAPAPAGEGYAASKQAALAATEQEDARIVAERRDDAALIRLRERLAGVDRAAELVLGRLEAVRAGSLEKWIDNLPGRSAPAAAPAGRGSPAMRPADIVEALAEDFRGPLRPPPDVTPAERDLLARHYSAAVAFALSYVAARAEAVAKLDEKAAAEAARLVLVVPLLDVPD